MQEGQATEDKAGDPQADHPADHLQEAHHTMDAQEDTEGAPHHTTLTPSPLHKTAKHQPTTQKTTQHN